VGPGPCLMKKEFTGPRSHKGWETLIYTIKLCSSLSFFIHSCGSVLAVFIVYRLNPPYFTAHRLLILLALFPFRTGKWRKHLQISNLAIIIHFVISWRSSWYFQDSAEPSSSTSSHISFVQSFNSNTYFNIPILSAIFSQPSHCSHFTCNAFNKFCIPISSPKM